MKLLTTLSANWTHRNLKKVEQEMFISFYSRRWALHRARTQQAMINRMEHRNKFRIDVDIRVQSSYDSGNLLWPQYRELCQSNRSVFRWRMSVCGSAAQPIYVFLVSNPHTNNRYLSSIFQHKSRKNGHCPSLSRTTQEELKTKN